MASVRPNTRTLTERKVDAENLDRVLASCKNQTKALEQAEKLCEDQHKKLDKYKAKNKKLSSEKDAMEREMDALKIRLRAKVAELKQKKDSIWVLEQDKITAAREKDELQARLTIAEQYKEKYNNLKESFALLTTPKH